MSEHKIPTGGKPCALCGGIAIVRVIAGGGGWSAGGEFNHAEHCAALRCEHGVRWQEDCPTCDAKAIANGEYDDVGEEDEQVQPGAGR